MRECTLIVKATRLCNLRCSYCNDWRAGPGNTMPFEVLARTVASVLRDPANDRVTFVWHGGEPTLLSLRWFERAIAVQARFARPGQQVRNMLQTNGVRMTPEWARFLAANEFSVGVSIDGPGELHDRHRRFVSGEGSLADALAGIRTLRDHHVRVGVLLVVDEDTVALGPSACLDFMLANDITSFGVNAVAPANQPDAPPGTPADRYVPPGRMTEYLKGLFDAWVEHGIHRVHIRELEALLARVHGDEAEACQLRGDCIGEYFIVEPDGEVAHCDLFLGDPAYRLGNVFTHSFAELRANAASQALREHRSRELADLAGCPEFGVCNGWCPHETYLSRRHDPDHRTGCCGLDGLIAHLRASGVTPHRQATVLAAPTLRVAP